MDAAHKWTDEQLEALERRMQAEYSQAAREMRAKQEKALAKYARELEQREKSLDATKEARAAHEAWLRGKAADQAWMQGMVDDLTRSATNANQKATAMLNDALPIVYAENANRAAFAIDKAIGMDTSFVLADESTVRHLMGLGESNGQLIHEVTMGPVLPRDPETMRQLQSLRKDMDAVKDWNWNRQKFTSAITQGVLQGESIPNITKRVQSVVNMDANSARRAARTATTAAENAGRVSSYRRAAAMGIPLMQEWMATPDDRTRPSHRDADGQQVEVGEFFDVGGAKMEYPGDPAGGDESWNCRCTLRGRVSKFDKRGGERWARLDDDVTYEEWKSSKPIYGQAAYTVAGRVMPSEWWAMPQTAAAPAQVEAAIDASAQIWQGAGAQVLPHAQELMAAASEATQRTWAAYEAELRLIDGSKKGGAYYSTARSGVFINAAEEMTNKCGPLETWFHEFGHAIDNRASIRGGGRSYEFYSHKRGLHESLQRELTEHVDGRWKALKEEVKKPEFKEWFTRIKGGGDVSAEDIEKAYRMGFIGSYERKSYKRLLENGQEEWISLNRELPELSKANAKKHAYAQISNELRDMPDTAQSSLSDMFEAATKGKAKGNWGHGASYWDSAGKNQATEGFAEFFSAMVIESETPEAMATLRAWVPESAKLFEEILGEVATL